MSIVGCFAVKELLSQTRVVKKNNLHRPTVRIGVDTGGTFTDFIYQVAGQLRVFKVADRKSVV